MLHSSVPRNCILRKSSHPPKLYLSPPKPDLHYQGVADSRLRLDSDHNVSSPVRGKWGELVIGDQKY